MKTAFLTLVIALAFLLIATMTMAQDATAQATAEATATPPVTIVASDPAPVSAADFVLKIVAQLVPIVALILMYRSVPISALKDVLKTASDAAAITDTPIDDMAVRIGTLVIDALNKPKEATKEG